MRIYEIKEDDLPDSVIHTVKGLWVIEMDNGERFFGCHTKEQAEHAMRKQPFKSAYKPIW